MLPLVQEGVVTDILYGLPVAQSKLHDLVDLSTKATIRVMIDSMVQLKSLLSQDQKWSVFIKVDCGTSRAGLPSDSSQLRDLIVEVLKQPTIDLFGFYCHAGHSYGATNMESAQRVFETEISCALEAVTLAREHERELQKYTISVGATPTAHAAQEMDSEQLLSSLPENVQLELHAGCYAINDIQQQCTSLISSSDIAIRVLAEVVSSYTDRRELLINAGTIALAKETSKVPGYGRAQISHNLNEWTVVRTSQEHGIMSGGDVESVVIGSKVLITPQHACITGSAYPFYFVVDSLAFDAKVVDIWVRYNGW